MYEKGKGRKQSFFILKSGISIFLIAAMLFIGYGGGNSYGGQLVVQAHSGRTDSQGGHHDYQNKSGLGSYHYHHGYEAHLHPNGVCPYSGNASSKPANGTVQAQRTEPAVNADDYKLVFDAAFYYNHYPDLQAVIGNEEQKLLEHFISYGMGEGRKGCEEFDVSIYREQNADLIAAYGNDMPKFYEHFISCGYKENRIHK